MKKIGRAVLAAAFASALGLTAGCPEEKPEVKDAGAPKKEEPKKPEIPEYAPTGDMADVKKAAAAGITADNAMDKAKALDGSLDEAIKKLEAPAEETE
jgi:hypothetical protein